VEHWKTRLLIDLLGCDEVAPIYVLRLWSHCQLRHAWRFESLSPTALRSICRSKSDAQTFEAAMLEAGFIARDGEALIVVGWEEYNASLVASWANGSRGGRPRKNVKSQPCDTQTDNPSETHGFPMGSLSKTHGEPIREEKTRQDITPPTPPSPGGDKGAETAEQQKPKRERKPRIALKTFLAACKANGVKPVTSYAPLMLHVDRVGLSADFLELAWDVFRSEHLDGGSNAGRLQADWQRHFANYVTKGYYRLWVCKPDGSFELTSTGQQARLFHNREAA
jgi:hypothetical protein